MARACFVDFDGTITDRDGFDVLVRHFASAEAWAQSERDLASGVATLRAVLARQTSYIRADFPDVYAYHVAQITLDPSFAPFVARCEARAVAVTVLSSGIGPLVRARLRDAGLERLAVVAPDVEIDRAGWRMHFADQSENGTDKAAVIRAAQKAGNVAHFIGDGRSDFDAALAADVRYAKESSKLERFLRERGVPFATFATFEDIRIP